MTTGAIMGGVVGGGVEGQILYVGSGNLLSGSAYLTWDSASGTFKTKNIQVSGTSPWADVKAYGAVGDGVTDDSAAIRLATAAIQAAGGGSVFFPYGQYLVNPGGLAASPLGAFTDLDGIRLISDGATLLVDPDTIPVISQGYIFSFVNCQNILVDGFNVIGPDLDITQTTIVGFEFVHLFQGCKNISMPQNNIYGLTLGLSSSRETTDPTSYISSGIHIGVLNVENCFYGVVAQYSGYDCKVDLLETDTIHRSYFVYGTKNHEANIKSKDNSANDVIIASYYGFGCDNIRINYAQDSDTTNSSDGGRKVVLTFDETQGFLRNIFIRLNINYNSSGQTGAHPFMITKQKQDGTGDASARGHVLANLELSGIVLGTPHYYAGGTPFAFGGYVDGNETYTSGDFWSNIAIRNFYSNTTQQALISATSFTDKLVLENVCMTGPIQMLSGSTFITAQLEVLGAKCENLYKAAGDGSYALLNVTASGGNNLAVTAAANKRYLTNVGASGDVNHTLPVAVPGMEFTFVCTAAHLINIIPDSSDKIRFTTVAGATASIGTALGSSIRLYCLVPLFWEVLSTGGTVTYN